MGFVEPIKTFPLPLIKSEIRIKNKKNKNKRGSRKYAMPNKEK